MFSRRPRPGSGRVERDLTGLLKISHERGTTARRTPPDLSDAEAAVQNRVIHEELREDQRARTDLKKLSEKLVSSAHDALAALQKLKKLPLRERAIRPTTQAVEVGTPSDGEKARWFDAYRPLVSARVLLLLEITFLVVEIFFWYSTFSEAIDRRDPWYAPERIGAVLLALLIPFVGIYAAWLLGKLGHRWFMAYPGISRRRHLGIFVGAFVFVLVLTAVSWLVFDRFDAAEQQFGANQIASPLPMACVFGAVMLVDMCARLVLASESHEQYRRTVRTFEKLERKVVRANKIHTQRWMALRTSVQYRRGQLGRIATVGIGLVTDAAAQWDRRDHSWMIAVPDSSLRPIPDEDPSDLWIPANQAMVSLGQSPRQVPQPLLDGAVNDLAVWLPLDQDSLRREIDTYWRELHQGESPPRDDDEQGPRPPNGSHGPEAPTRPYALSNGSGDTPGEH
ncbi:hypothetical protein [Actinophytocola oryzae]|nr:hypothetical protein [Actinophytocola oryzae]